MKVLLFILLGIGFFPLFAKAQNSVVNFDFENVDSDFEGGIANGQHIRLMREYYDKVEGWRHPRPTTACLSTVGTPDILLYRWGAKSFGNFNGFTLGKYVPKNFEVEYLITRLEPALRRNQRYLIDLQMRALGPRPNNLLNYSHGAGLYFSNDMPRQCGFRPLHVSSGQIVKFDGSSVTSDRDNGQMGRVLKTFTSDKDWSLVALGRFEESAGAGINWDNVRVQPWNEREVNVHALKGVFGPVDVNGDGWSDIVHRFRASGSGALVIRTQISDGNGGFSAINDTHSDGTIVDQVPMITADVNGDQKTDLVFFAQLTNGLEIRTKISNGDGTYSPVLDFNGDGAGILRFAPMVGDFDGDGKDDIALRWRRAADGRSLIRVKLSDGSGGWSTQETLLADQPYRDLFEPVVGDVNGDGLKDIVTQFYAGRTHEDKLENFAVSLLLSNGDGTFTEEFWETGLVRNNFDAAMWDRPALLTNLSGDGARDLLLFERHEGDGLHMSVVTFTAQGIEVETERLGDGKAVDEFPILPMDVDADGDDDLVMRWRRNSGELVIRTKLNTDQGWNTVDFEAGDGWGVDAYPALVTNLNNDQRPDLYLRYREASSGLLRARGKLSNGDGTWEHVDIPMGFGRGTDNFVARSGFVAPMEGGLIDGPIILGTGFDVKDREEPFVVSDDDDCEEDDNPENETNCGELHD